MSCRVTDVRVGGVGKKNAYMAPRCKDHGKKERLLDYSTIRIREGVNGEQKTVLTTRKLYFLHLNPQSSLRTI